VTPGRYRWRTSFRRHMPWSFIGLAPKGKTDCGDHEWYKHSDDEDRCYHCEVGVRSPSEFPTPTVDLFEKYGIERPRE
jgi:hypothetical protein